MPDTLQLHSFSMPVDSVTLTKATSANGGEEWIIQGLASTNSLDQQNEIVLVKGLDLSYLESGRGTFNWNHRGDADPSSVVGLITEARRTDNNELFVRGKLLKSLPKAKHVYQLMKALETDAPDRKMGMSIEGKVLARNGQQIVKAWVKAVALTLDPVNKDTWVTFAKSLDAMEWVAPESDELSALPGEVLEETFATTLSKTLSKTLSVAATSGPAVGGPPAGQSILTPESLEEELHDQGYDAATLARSGDPQPPNAPARPNKATRPGRREKIRKSYTYSEAVARLTELEPTIPNAWAHKIVRFTFSRLAEE